MKLNRLKYRQHVALSKHNTIFLLFDQNRTARLKQKLNQQQKQSFHMKTVLPYFVLSYQNKTVTLKQNPALSIQQQT